MDDKDLITQGIEWLVKNIEYRDVEANKAGGLAEQYAGRQLRVLSRIRAFITESEQNNNNFHDLVLEMKLPQEFFEMFFKMYSLQSRIYKPVVVDEEFDQINGKWIKR